MQMHDTRAFGKQGKNSSKALERERQNRVMQPDDIEGMSRKDKQKSLISQTQGQYQEGREREGEKISL